MSEATSDAELNVEEAELKKEDVVEETWSPIVVRKSFVEFRKAERHERVGVSLSYLLVESEVENISEVENMLTFELVGSSGEGSSSDSGSCDRDSERPP